MPKFAFVIDLDGVVFKRSIIGYELIPGSSKALELVRSRDIPVIFLSNGTSQLESEKAASLNKLLGSDIYTASDVVLASTPFAELAKKYQHGRVLIVSRSTEESAKFAKNHNWKNYISVQDYSKSNPILYPSNKHSTKTEMQGQETIDAIMIYSEPQDWAEAIQIICDCCHYSGHLGKESSEQIPVYSTNPDLVYATNHSVPRLTLGSFVQFCQLAYRNYTSKALVVEQCGKPYSPCYRECEKRFHSNRDIDMIFAIGDNPSSDIQGANLAGKGWKSVLVKTGVYKQGIPEFAPNYTYNNLLDAVEAILDIS